jgi:uncharacterized lipoprotein YddW (UPF0748 family)
MNARDRSREDSRAGCRLSAGSLALSGVAPALLLALALLLVPRPTASSEPEARIAGVWVTRWAFKSAKDVRTLFDDLAGIGINTVFFQVRGAGDAFYRSTYEPWSGILTDTLGKDPGWDPLKVAVTEGHRRNLKVHAWVNVFTAWPVTPTGDPPAATEPVHPYLAHPDWVACDRDGRPMPIKKAETTDNYAFFSPTRRDVQEHVIDVVSEIVGKYRVDGIHFDYARFPDSCYSYDAASRAAYMRALLTDSVSFSEWRRQQLTEFVGELSRRAKAARPGVEVSAAVWQVIASGRTGYYQDGVEWVKRGYADFLVPMIYTTSPGSFYTRLEGYVDSVGADKVVAGIGAYLEEFDASILWTQMGYAQSAGARGICIFNSASALNFGDVLRRGLSDAPSRPGRRGRAGGRPETH